MPITVERSPNVQLDESAEMLLQTIVERLELQSEKVKSVQILPNFSVDTDMSLKFDANPIAQGLVVCVAKSYKLGPEDVSWFHPSIARGRTVFSLTQQLTKDALQKVELTSTNSSVGVYAISSPDEFGCEQTEHRLVVDVAHEDMLLPLHKKWLQQGLTAEAVEKQWKRMKFGDTYSIVAQTSALRAEIANKIAPSAVSVSSDTVNDVLSDIENVYFTNNVVRPDSSGQILVKFSALGGYRVYNAGSTQQRFYPATLGASASYYSWDNMTSQNCARIEQSCAWGGKLKFNTQVMTPPAIPVKKLRAVEDEFELTHADTLAMRISAFSPCDSFVDNISPKHLYKLEPSTHQIQNANDYITAPISMNHAVMQKLMTNIEMIQSTHPGFQLFNPKFMSGNRFKIPRDVYKLIA